MDLAGGEGDVMRCQYREHITIKCPRDSRQRAVQLHLGSLFSLTIVVVAVI